VQENFDSMVDGIDNLSNLNKQSERLYAESDKLFREAKRDVLANGHQYGESERPLERLILSFEPELKEYKKQTNDGNYYTANQHVNDIKEDLESLRENMLA